MQNLERRIALLEAKGTQETDAVRVVFPRDGETAEEARRREGIPDDWPGKVIMVRFVASGGLIESAGKD